MADRAFPLSAIVGQDDLIAALLVNAVDPGVGGVLVRGDRGTAKSTAVRGLTPLLPMVEAAVGQRYAFRPGEDSPVGVVPVDADVELRPAPLVELPVGATADRVVGSVDLERALAEGVRVFQPGLLAAAHQGVLYVDEVNLLPDHLVDLLLDAAALRTCHVEREGISVRHAARFLLVGTMNPEEGELRPQLLDRFGLSVHVHASLDPGERAEIIRRRLAFDDDPRRFAAAWQAADDLLAERILGAQRLLPRVELSHQLVHLIASTCAGLGLNGVRGDIVTTRAARALAALDGARAVDETHVRRAARLALGHRRQCGPLQAAGITSADVDRAMFTASRGSSGGENADGAGGESAVSGRPGSEPEDPGAPGGARLPLDSDTARGIPPAVSQAGPEPEGGGAGKPGRSQRQRSGASATALERRDDPSGDVSPHPPRLELATIGDGPAGRRSRAAGRLRHSIDTRPASPGATDLAPLATLRASTIARASSDSRRRPTVADLREHVRAGRESNLIVFLLDASGSMGAHRRMGAVKAAAQGLLLDAYQRRDQVALVTFRGEDARVAVQPTSSAERVAAALLELSTGGRTPLAAGLDTATELIRREHRRNGARRALAIVVTDGRASDNEETVRQAADRLGRAAHAVTVFDSSPWSPASIGYAGVIAAAAKGGLKPLSALLAAGDTTQPPGPAQGYAAGGEGLSGTR